MNLEIKSIRSDVLAPGETPEDSYNFNIPLRVEIGEKGETGGEVFHFTAASPAGLEGEVGGGEFKLLRGYILMARFDWATARRAFENIIDHARGYRDGSWAEAIEFFSRYGRYDSENIHSQPSGERRV
jgi:hypothetical protein